MHGTLVGNLEKTFALVVAQIATDIDNPFKSIDFSGLTLFAIFAVLNMDLAMGDIHTDPIQRNFLAIGI
mgnify:CR=1 FL=1